DGANWRSRLQARCLVFNLCNDQHFFQLAQIGGRPHPNIEKRILARLDGGHNTDIQAFGEDLIAATGEHALPGFDHLTAQDFLQHHLSRFSSLQDAVNARLLGNDADPAAGIVDQQHTRGVVVIYVEDLPHHALRGNHGLVRLDSVRPSLIDVHQLGFVCAAGTDNLRRNGLLDEVLFEAEKQLQAASLAGVFLESNLLQAHVLDLLLELTILGSYSAQVDVIVED